MELEYYRVTDWQDHFEVNRSRELKKAKWVAIPNKHDGDGYTELMTTGNGPENFAAWILIVQVASKCEIRGRLVRDGNKPHDSYSLSRMTHAPVEVFERAIPVLLEIGWLERVREIPQEGATIPQEGAISVYTVQDSTVHNSKPPKVPQGDEEGGKKKKPKRIPDPKYTDQFSEFWYLYPNKVGKGKAFESWAKLGCDDKLIEVARAIELYKRSEAWTKEGGKYVPMPATWLNQRRWEDTPPGKIVERQKASTLNNVFHAKDEDTTMTEAF